MEVDQTAEKFSSALDPDASRQLARLLRSCRRSNELEASHRRRSRNRRESDRVADRVHALRLSQSLFSEGRDTVAPPRKWCLKLEDDPSPFVRFQLALTAGELHPKLGAPLLAKLLRRPDADPWLVTAVLSSAKDRPPGCSETWPTTPTFATSPPGMLGQLAAMVGARGIDVEMPAARSPRLTTSKLRP